MQITSPQNNRIKNVVKLNDRRYRDSVRLTVVEGVREVNRALQNQVIPQEAYICPALLDGAEANQVVQTLRQLAENGRIQLFEVTPDVYAKMAYREESGGLLLVIPYFTHTLETLPLSPIPFLVIIAGAEKPGNVGAILRTADVAGVDGVILTTNNAQTGTDIYNPNVIRASLGAIFTVPIVAATEQETISWLKAHQITMVATTPTAQTAYTAVSLTTPVAIIMGSESQGLSSTWLTSADRQVFIPMYGKVDSLNLSTATAILLYEVVRQRKLITIP